MRMVDLIAKKRDGLALTEEEIRFLIQGYTEGIIPDYQMAAWAMAVVLRGMSTQETAVLTDAMMRSGDQVDLSCFGQKSVDKHSTGGVGDKTTLIVAPIVAALGGKVAKMSGRGLGHTGGTIDKLEAIRGFRTTLTPEEFRAQVEKIGVAVIGQSGNLTPADKKLYALRDVTATVDSIPLIASSVMSKKLAAGSRSIVLDVKFGSGAFMKTAQDAEVLARTMVDIGTACGRNTAALLTNMDIPLGSHVGNALEVREAAQVLQGKPGDLRTICVELAAQMLMLCHGWTEEHARAQVLRALDTGLAWQTMQLWIEAQGGDPDLDHLPESGHIVAVTAPQSGWITHMDTAKIGIASSLLGAGRMKKDDPIDPAAGIVLAHKTGDYVPAGEIIAWLHTNRLFAVEDAQTVLEKALSWGSEPATQPPLIAKTIRAFS